MGKSTTAEINLRVEKVTEFLLKGWSRKKICEYTLNNKWSVSSSQVDRYIKKASEEIKAQSEKNTIADYALAVARLEYLYSEAVERGNLNLAVKIIKDLTTLQGLSRLDAHNKEPEYNDKGELYNVFNCYAQAIKSTVSEGQLKEIVEKATSSGTDGGIERTLGKDSPTDDYLKLAVEDYRLINRARTREELERDGWQSINLENIDLYL